MKLHFKNDLETRLFSMTLEDRSYFLKYLPAHLAESGLLEQLEDLLTDCSFMQTKITDYDPLLLISDYDMVPGNKGLQTIREVLRLSAHILAREPGQLWPQLYGRLFHDKDPSNHTMMFDWPKSLWLRARTRSLAVPGSPPLMTLDEQDDPIADLAVTQDGGRVVSGSESGRLRVWDLESGALLYILDGHEDEITSVVIINDTQVISGSRDNTLRIWHLDKGDCRAVLRGHSDDITVIKVIADGRMAFSASRDKTARLSGIYLPVVVCGCFRAIRDR